VPLAQIKVIISLPSAEAAEQVRGYWAQAGAGPPPAGNWPATSLID